MNTTVMQPAAGAGAALGCGPLAAAAAYFISVYNARPDLIAEQRGWDRAIALVASDSGESVAIRAAGGRLLQDASPPLRFDIVITSDVATLCDVLELRTSPNEPYLFGELLVSGSEHDFVRIDYIAAALCPA